MTFGPEHYGVANDDHGLQEGALFAVVLGAHGIQGGQLLLGFLLDAVEAALQDFGIVVHPLDGRTEGRGLIDDKTGNQAFGIVVGQLVHFGRQGGIKVLMIGLAFPVRRNFLNDALGVLGRDSGRGSPAGGQLAHGDVQKVAVQFGIENAVAAVATGTAQQKLIFLHTDRNIFGDVHERLGPTQHQGLAFGFLHGLGEVQGAFNIDTRLLPVEAFQQFENAGVRFAEFVLFALDPIIETLFLGGPAFAGGHAHHPTPDNVCGAWGTP